MLERTPLIVHRLTGLSEWTTDSLGCGGNDIAHNARMYSASSVDVAIHLLSF